MSAKTPRRPRESRLGFRVDPSTKALIERAAQIRHSKVSDFCMSILTEAAQRTVAAHDVLALSDEDRATFFDVLVNPPAPNDRLQRAFADHAKRVTQE